MILSLLGLKQIILQLPRPLKRFIVFVFDILSCAVSVVLAYYLRIGEFLSLFEPAREHFPFYAFLLSVSLSIPIFISFNFYRVIFRYSGAIAIIGIIKAFLVYSFFYSILIAFYGVEGVPRTIGFIQPILFFLILCFSRLTARFFLSETINAHIGREQLPKVFVYGAGKSGRQLATSLRSIGKYDILGFLDDNSEIQQNQIDGLKVFSLENLESSFAHYKISEVFLAMPNLKSERLAEIIDRLSGYNCKVTTIPNSQELFRVRNNKLLTRSVRIEDILGREPVKPIEQLLLKDIKCKDVLITGAGGSIGGELARIVLIHKPKKLILLDNSEFALYALREELLKLNEEMSLNVDVSFVLGCVTDRSRLCEVFSKYTPNTIYHAAAYKHVKLVEENPFEGINNNTFGTLVCAECAIEFGVQKFVFVSTDKAVRPSSIMGASKRLAEIVIQQIAQDCVTTVFAIVRFGNVLKSSGSVVPIFEKQIQNGGPVTVTHKEVTRFFMTIEEAALLVIQAGAISSTTTPEYSKNGLIFLLDMGEPIKIFDLAKKMIKLSNLELQANGGGSQKIDIKFIGLGKGEKLNEELLLSDKVLPTSHKKINISEEITISEENYNEIISDIRFACESRDIKRLEKTLNNQSVGYHHE